MRMLAGDEPPQSSPGDACGIALAAPSRTSLIPWGAPTLRGRYGAVRRIGWNRTIGLPVPNGVRCHCATIRSPPASAGEPCVHFPVPAQPGAVEPGLRRRLCYGREGNPCLRRNSRIRTDGLALPKRARCLLRHVPMRCPSNADMTVRISRSLPYPRTSPVIYSVDLAGVEPAAFALRTRRSAN